MLRRSLFVMLVVAMVITFAPVLAEPADAAPASAIGGNGGIDGNTETSGGRDDREQRCIKLAGDLAIASNGYKDQDGSWGAWISSWIYKNPADIRKEMNDERCHEFDIRDLSPTL